MAGCLHSYMAGGEQSEPLKSVPPTASDPTDGRFAPAELGTAAR